MSRSSIFSSESLDLRPGEPAWRQAATVVLIAAIVLVAGEAAARVVLKDVGRRWEYWHPVAATKFEFVRTAAEQGHSLRTLVVGDSTGMADLDPRVLERELGPASWNAAWSGNFPLAFEETTLPLLADTRLRVDWIIASFIPAGFAGTDTPTSSEAGLLASTYVQKRSVRQTGDHVHLARLRSAWPLLLNDLLGRKEAASVTRFGFAANQRTATAEMIAEEPAQPPVTSLNDRRLRVLKALVDVAQQRHSRLLVVIPPSLTTSPARVSVARLLRETLALEQAQGRLHFIDLLQPGFLEMTDFADVNHLNGHGAEALTMAVATAIKGASGATSPPVSLSSERAAAR
jgi:hypothetical protein